MPTPTNLTPEVNVSYFRDAAQSVIYGNVDKVESEVICQNLLEAEKAAKKQKKRYTYDQLYGKWRLCWVTGTKRVRHRAGIALGTGRYLPRWLKIQITYTQTEETDLEATEVRGQVENLVQLGTFQISLSGLVKFLTGKNLLVFDFTRMKIGVFGLTLYDGYIRGGKKTEATFYETPIKKQAFFNYFWVDDEMIAARGKGGGLALWGRSRGERVSEAQ
jgi:hypothetical protein